MTNKTFCKSCRVPTRQLRVKSSLFRNVSVSDLKEQFQQWNGMIHVSKKKEQNTAYVHFSTDDLASICYQNRNNATINGKKVYILPVSKDKKPVNYVQRPISSPLPTLACEPQQQSERFEQQQFDQQQQTGRDAFKNMMKRKLDEIDDILEIREKEIQKIKKTKKFLEKLLDP
ncbi:hypothetical protein BDC45DRAFT_518178 [Circinella umbellata]|nr:hypothetical protein BDC45DRAFT_518178 [Circinella umbellata]